MTLPLLCPRKGAKTQRGEAATREPAKGNHRDAMSAEVSGRRLFSALQSVRILARREDFLAWRRRSLGCGFAALCPSRLGG